MTLLKSLMTGAAVAGLFCALANGTAFAQGGPRAAKQAPQPVKSQGLIEKEREAARIDEQYKAQLQRSKNEPVTTKANDPWSNMRTTGDAKTDIKTTTKTELKKKP